MLSIFSDLIRSKTVKELLDAYKGAVPGFDALRLILASIILLWHTDYVCYGRFSPQYDWAMENLFTRAVLRSILPMFFFLGGFLVTASAYRVRSARTFFMYRALRIVPALLVEVLLCAVVLGAFLTTLPLSQYYTHPDFFSYFLNIVGLIHFTLPGVFEVNTLPTTNVVNINLWTLPPDFEGYAIMLFLMATGLIFDKKNFLYIVLFSQLYFLCLLPALNWGDTGTVFVRDKLLIYSFLLGVACYSYAEKIRISKLFMALSVTGLCFFWWKQTIILGVIAACYLTLCIGFTDLRKFPLTKKGDYSYGIYLYGFPIERTLFHFIPALHEWWQLFIVAFPVTLIFAMLSWRFIEKPCLGLKRHFKKPSPVHSAV